MKFPTFGNGNCEPSAKGNKLHNQSKRLSEIQPFNLVVAKNNETGFVSFNHAIKLKFDMINRFASKSSLTRRKRSKCPGAIFFSRASISSFMAYHHLELLNYFREISGFNFKLDSCQKNLMSRRKFFTSMKRGYMIQIRT